MKIRKMALFFAAAAGFAVAAHSQSEKSAVASATDAASAKAFLGRWDLTLKAPDREYPSWLELREEGGQLKAQ
jgi:hypothetical protein